MRKFIILRSEWRREPLRNSRWPARAAVIIRTELFGIYSLMKRSRTLFNTREKFHLLNIPKSETKRARLLFRKRILRFVFIISIEEN